MPLFRYQAVDHAGQSVNGVMAAPDETNLERKLSTAGLWLIGATPQSVRVVRQRNGRPSFLAGLAFRGHRKRRELIDFCTLMAFQTKVGVTLVQALEVAATECETPFFQEVLVGLRRHIEGGLLFWEALEKYPSIFPLQMVSVVRAGEQSSKLPETFAELKDYLEWADRISADVRQASLYPMIVLVVVSAFVLFLFTAVIPKFVALLSAVNAKLPLITVVIFSASDFAKATWWVWVALLLFLTVGTRIGRRISKGFARWIDSMLLRVPVFGELNGMLSMSRFAHTLAILYRSGIPILQALNLCRGVAGNAVIADAIGAVEESVKSGDTISEAMRRQEAFPSMLLRMVIMGETTGNLDAALENVSDYYNQIIPRRIKKVFTIMEPALIVFLVFLVGAVALGIFLPIISLMGSIR